MNMVVGPAGLVIEVVEARSAWQRMKGLLGTDDPPQGRALLMRGKQVHTLGMRYAIDVVYLDKHHGVLKVSCLRPNRVGPLVLRAAYILEMAEGQAELLGFKPGLRIQIR